MKIEYKRSIQQSFMMITGDNVYEEYELEMFQNTIGHNYLSVKMIEVNGKKEFWYDITGKQSLDTYLQNHYLTMQELYQLIVNINEAVLMLQGSLLHENSLLLTKDTIFLEKGSMVYYFCFLPMEKKSLSLGFMELMEYLLAKIDHEDEKAVELGYEIYQETLNEQYSISMIQREMEKHMNQNLYEEEEEILELKEEIAYEPSMEKEEKIYGKFDFIQFLRPFIEKIKAKKKTDFDFQEEDIIAVPEEKKEGKTIYLGENYVKGILIYQGNKNYQDLYIKDKFVILGSREEMVQLFINDETISRMHAKISVKNDKIFIEDLNSTNGTYINGKLLPYKEEVELHYQDRISFAKEEFLLVEG